MSDAIPEAHIGDAILASFLAGGVATALGGLAALAIPTLTERRRSALMGFSAGVMLGAAFLALLIPAIEIEVARGAPYRGLVLPMAGLLAGATVIALLDRFAPHEHFLRGHEGPASPTLARTWLFVIAIALHNVPEGLAVGVGVASGDASLADAVTLSIGLQNAPEGLIVAVALLAEKYSRARALWYAALSGIVEPVGAAFGFAAANVADAALPVALAFAGGAMIYVVSGEVIPESHRGEGAKAATWGTVVGCALALVLGRLG
jgi:ZIP family zinc transporter